MVIKTIISKTTKVFKGLCTPARIEFILTIIGAIATIITCFASFSETKYQSVCSNILPSTIVSGIFIWILNSLCKGGAGIISWILVVGPLFIMLFAIFFGKPTTERFISKKAAAAVARAKAAGAVAAAAKAAATAVAKAAVAKAVADKKAKEDGDEEEEEEDEDEDEDKDKDKEEKPKPIKKSKELIKFEKKLKKLVPLLAKRNKKCVKKCTDRKGGKKLKRRIKKLKQKIKDETADTKAQNPDFS